ncbi:MAG: diguanylate cyclase [Acidobacteria bacterium]|nr:diguanylate cyclase [Acidobacteriota bacterium]
MSPGRWVGVLAIVTVAGSALEVSVHPAPGILVTPLVVSAVALVFAYRVHVRNQASQASHQRQLVVASELRLSTIEALALAIDARDRLSQSQLRREQVYAGALAKAFGMSDDEVEGVRTAALLHDIGKLAVPDHILTKRTPLTDEERSKLQAHPAAGSAIIANVPFPYPVASSVRSHHERWDGTGYPEGLRASEIPLGARIIAVVDCFATITSEAPFTGTLPLAEAINALWHEAGKSLDPAVVARFAELLPQLIVEPQAVVRAPGVLERDPGASSTTAGAPAAAAGSVRRRDRVLDHIAEANHELFALYEIAQAMGTSLGLNESMAVIAAKLAHLVPFSTCVLFLHDAAEDVARCRFATGRGAGAFRDLAVPAKSGLVGEAIARRECVANRNPAEDFSASSRDFSDIGLASSLICPLVLGDSVVGALALYHTVADCFTDDHRRLATLVSDQVAAVVSNALLFQQTQEESVTDPLTGLLNTRFLFPHLSREMSRAGRLKSPLAILMLDLDNMKTINDSFGHHAGDRALCMVADVLRSAIRPYDVCVRYGGDEFIVVLSDCGAEQAEAKRQELQSGVESAPFRVGEVLRARLAMSAGAAVYPTDGDTYDALLNVADTRMYRDKAERKRRDVRER